MCRIALKGTVGKVETTEEYAAALNSLAATFNDLGRIFVKQSTQSIDPFRQPCIHAYTMYAS
jgi:hypothetical protein